MATLIDSDKFTLTTDGTFDLGSAPAVGQTDVFCVNSNTVINGLSDPTGGAAINAAESAVTNQGAYIFVRKATGGEGQTVALDMSGTSHSTTVTWSRWSDLDAVDTSTNTQVNGSVGTVTPAHSTGVMAETGELCIAFAALHSIGTANQNTPAWTQSFVSLFDTPAVSGSGATGALGWVAYKQGVGTAAETPQVSWSGDGVQNRYMLTVTFTSAGQSAAAGTAVETDTAVAITRAKAKALGSAAETDEAVALTRLKARTVGRTDTTDTAGAIGRNKARTIGTAVDTSTAVAINRTKARVLGTATETDQAIALTGYPVAPRPAAAAHLSGAQRAAHYGGPQTAVAIRG